MNIVNGEIVVLDIAGTRARVACGKPDAESHLIALGFFLEGNQMIRQLLDVEDRQKIIKALIEIGALFSTGRGWSPAELVDLYREQGSILTGYRMITWKNSNQYLIVDR